MVCIYCYHQTMFLSYFFSPCFILSISVPFFINIAKDKDMVKASKWLEPIVFAKRCLNDKKQPYQITLFSFQSTGATNIMTVNSVLNGNLHTKESQRE